MNLLYYGDNLDLLRRTVAAEIVAEDSNSQ
jgi:hypothetical protein